MLAGRNDLVTKDGVHKSYDCCDIGLRARLDYNLDVRGRKLIPSGSDLIEADILRPED